MITIATILWLISGVASFFVVLRRLWQTIHTVVDFEFQAIKYAALAGMFLFHTVGGLISLGITIYKHFKGA